MLTMAGLGPPPAALEDDSPTGRLRSGAPRGPSGELEVVAAAGEGSGWTGFGRAAAGKCACVTWSALSRGESLFSAR